jgi:hypothetical protein
MKISKGLLLFLCVGLLLASCATTKNIYDEVDIFAQKTDFESALAAIELAQTIPAGKRKANDAIYSEKNQILYHLDKGILEHYAGKYNESVKDFEEAEWLIEAAYTKSITQEIGTYFGNDNAQDYGGEDYEDIYTNVFNALNFYHQGQIEAAGVEVRQISEKLALLGDKYIPKKDSNIRPELVAAFVADAAGLATAAAGLPGFLVDIPPAILTPPPVGVLFTDTALARYLSAIFYRGDNRPDDARIDLDAIAAIKGGSVPASIADEYEVPSGKGRLNIIGFTGLSPVKVEKIEDLDLFFFPILSTLRPLDNKSMRLTVGNLALPALAPRPDTIQRVSVEVNGTTIQLELLEDMGDVMTQTFNVKYPAILTKTYIRAIIKYISVEVAAQVVYDRGMPSFAVLAAALGAKKVVDAGEKADIRAGRYFPAKAYVGGITLDPGTYNVTFNFNNGDSVTKKVTVEANRANIVEAINLK